MLKFCFILLLSLVSAQFVEEIEETLIITPPKPWQKALMARYIIRTCGWVSIATISTLDSVRGFPFVTLKSMSDGLPNNSTGIPYLYMTDMDVSGADVKVNNNVTILATLAETSYCEQKDFDPQDPRCAKVIISGQLVKVDNSSQEFAFGKQALFSKHPEMVWWPADHDFYVAKINLQQIAVLDFFGGIKYVSVEDYLKTDPNSSNEYDVKFEDGEFVGVSVIVD